MAKVTREKRCKQCGGIRTLTYEYNRKKNLTTKHILCDTCKFEKVTVVNNKWIRS